MTDTRFNGWTNQATWVVNLHLDNDSGTHEMVAEWAEEALDAAEACETFTVEQNAAFALAEQIKEFVEDELEAAIEAMPVSWGKLLVQDLMNDGVNWHEIAQSNIKDAVDSQA